MLDKLVKINKYPDYLRLLWWRIFIPNKLKQMGVEVDSTTVFYGKPIVSLAPESRISIGRRCSLCSVSEFTALGVNHPVILRTLRPGAVISIGNDSGISGVTICAALSVEIGSNVLLGANVVIVDTDFHAIKPHGRRYNSNPQEIRTASVYIGNNVFIGSGAFVLKGSHVGENSVIGAGSVVTGDIPPNVIAAGNPAKVVKEIET